MISMSVPSYSPMVRARAIVPVRPLQVLHRSESLDNGSPHVSHTGGVIGRIDAQQFRHTHPDNGSSRIESQTTHAGARSAATNALPTRWTIRKHSSDWWIGD
jgi:hypothetical protein